MATNVTISSRRRCDQGGPVAMRSKEQELQRSKADQNAKIAHRWGIHYLEENKPNKKVRFAPEVCQGNELTEAVRNLRLDGRSLVDTALKADNRDSPQAWLDALISNAPCVMSWLSKEV
ncbi:hypothetical protein M406DRAFT_71454 [Cryphonectria parasitica EP155]|uniref:Uncharacterized protein n=1 Tax=Cryphonectria parasitica (strain ATCC 38755 / EP155) TaxID=660469 RepID=A0A9P4Y8I9_CRYP1|nr:uncharacterized protein M406DRAFT_71454 [Cryphonectria parasitica EP155]KAF3768446.1 hypothetical protein M406DRAFT_71454 [Cryphonectria parasitica EP155]